MQVLDRNELVQKLLNQHGGKIFSIKFIRKDGTSRLMAARLGVSKGVKCGGAVRPSHLVTVYEMRGKFSDFRSFDKSRLEAVQIKGKVCIREVDAA